VKIVVVVIFLCVYDGRHARADCWLLFGSFGKRHACVCAFDDDSLYWSRERMMLCGVRVGAKKRNMIGGGRRSGVGFLGVFDSTDVCMFVETMLIRIVEQAA
jgi:hypothetical protein